jgi:hypothetical protein
VLFPMSSSSVDSDNGAEEETINGDVVAAATHLADNGGNEDSTHAAGGRIAELLQEERDGGFTPLGNGTNRYRLVQQTSNESEDGSSEILPRRPESPIESILSNPDDSPSVQVVWQHLPA